MDATFRIFARRFLGETNSFVEVVHQLCGERVLLTQEVNVDELPRICDAHQCYKTPEEGAT